MRGVDIHEQARMLKAAHGNKAIAEAARKANEYEQAGSADEAATWRRIEKALLQMRGAGES